MAAIYSTQFILDSMSTGSVDDFVIPVNAVAVIRDIQLILATTLDDQAVFQIRDSVTLTVLWKAAIPGPLEVPLRWEGRIVSQPSRVGAIQGFTASLQGAATTCEAYVGGYVLQQ